MTYSVDLVSTLRLVIAAVGGFATGFVASMVGFGGGRPRLLLVYWAVESPMDAAGTNILVGALGGLLGTWRHLRAGRIDFQLLAVMGIPTIAGAFLGGFFGGLAPRAALLIAVGIITTWYGYRLLTSRDESRDEAESDSDLPAAAEPALGNNPGFISRLVRRRLLAMSLGFSIGIFGGAVGLIGGQLRHLSMVEFLGTDLRVVAGTNRAIGTMMGLAGFLGHLLHLELDWLVLVILLPMAMLGSYLGARQTGRISPQYLRRWMGTVMVITSLPMFWLAYTQL
ncbi:MAG: sulfite exporter TauE/SafE family protein [Dehalococcoidia bacterium]